MNMLDMMKQLQGIQDKAASLKEELAAQTVTGESAAGLVQVVLGVDGVCKKLFIDPSLVANGCLNEDEGRGVFEDLIRTAYNNAVEKAKEAKTEATSKILGDLQLPAGLNTLL